MIEVRGYFGCGSGWCGSACCGQLSTGSPTAGCFPPVLGIACSLSGFWCLVLPRCALRACRLAVLVRPSVAGWGTRLSAWVGWRAKAAALLSLIGGSGRRDVRFGSHSYPPPTPPTPRPPLPPSLLSSLLLLQVCLLLSGHGPCNNRTFRAGGQEVGAAGQGGRTAGLVGGHSCVGGCRPPLKEHVFSLALWGLPCLAWHQAIIAAGSRHPSGRVRVPGRHSAWYTELRYRPTRRRGWCTGNLLLLPLHVHTPS